MYVHTYMPIRKNLEGGKHTLLSHLSQSIIKKSLSTLPLPGSHTPPPFVPATRKTSLNLEGGKYSLLRRTCQHSLLEHGRFGPFIPVTKTKSKTNSLLEQGISGPFVPVKKNKPARAWHIWTIFSNHKSAAGAPAPAPPPASTRRLCYPCHWFHT